MNPEALSNVERLLAQAWNGAVRAGGVETLREDRCYRIRFAEAPSDAPASAIVKMAGPDAPEFPFGMLDEWAGLAFLGEVAPEGLAPVFYGGDKAHWLVVSEDLGETDSVATALQGDDPDRAREALALHAEAVADLHAATLGKEDRYNAIRDALGPRSEDRGMGWGNLRRLRPEMEASFALVGQAPTRAFWDEYESLAGAIDNPGPFRAFVHNDSCPDNTVLEPGRVRLIDFEVGGYHSCLLDAAYARLCMPHCWLVQRLPDDVAPWVERRYRDRLAPAMPEANDGALFGRRMAEACAYWIVSNGTWRLQRGWQEDWNWGAATWRQRVLMRLDQFARIAEESSHLPEMGHAARETLRRLEDRWSVEPMPLYPPFR